MPLQLRRHERYRAQLVCVQCHLRKVKCNLEARPDAPCRNCYRRGQDCRPWNGGELARKSRGLEAVDDGVRALSNPSVAAINGPTSELPTANMTSQGLATMHDNTLGSPASSITVPTERDLPGYVGEDSFMLCASPPKSNEGSTSRKLGTFTEMANREILRVTGAAVLPSRLSVRASVDAYFKHVFHVLPVIDRQDLSGEASSTLLLQALCLLGSMLRQPGPSDSRVHASEELYVKTKTLLDIGYEKDSLLRMKALCLVANWHITSPLESSSNCIWHWTGVAIRLMYQLGLHRESTYTALSRPRTCRRIAWHLFAQDKLQSACYGRPVSVSSRDFDVRPLQPDDYEVFSQQARISMAFVDLTTLLGKMLDLRGRTDLGLQEEVSRIFDSLVAWIASLPSPLRLYQSDDDEEGTNHYEAGVFELHVLYFVTIILFFHLCGHLICFPTAGITSLVASSCIVRLYEEMSVRDDINYLLAANNWYLVVGCIPQINYETSCYNEHGLCTEELNVLTTILKDRQPKWPQTTTLLYTLEQLRMKKKAGGNGLPSMPAQQSTCSIDRRVISATALRGLFPFPDDLCRRMELLGEEEFVDADGEAINVAPLLDEMGENFDWMFTEYAQLTWGGTF